LEKYGVKIGDQHPSIRMVLHRDVSDEGLDKAIAGFKSFYQ
jgi:threonine aldolase